MTPAGLGDHVTASTSRVVLLYSTAFNHAALPSTLLYSRLDSTSLTTQCWRSICATTGTTIHLQYIENDLVRTNG